MGTTTAFGVALTRAREAAGLSQTAIGVHLTATPNTVHRWERRGFLPSMERRIAILLLLKNVPRPLLETLAAESGVNLVGIGLGPPPPVVTALPPVVVPVPSPIPETAQATIDNAVREAAEDMDVSPKVLRPALSRLLDQIARGGVPIDAAARMVLGVPKREKPETDAKQAKEEAK